MQRKKFNLIASVGAFLLGTVYVFSDGASITANVVGASGSSTGAMAIYGIFMIMGSIGLFIVSMNSTDHKSIDLERLIRKTKDHRDLNSEPLPRDKDEAYKEIKHRP